MKRKNIIALIIASVLWTHNVWSQNSNDKLLLTIDNDSIYLSEFLYIYKKNNPNPSYAFEDLKEYLELFTNYKLIVKEAKDLGRDTLPAFVNEFAGYRKQLARPYLSDNEVTEKLINEAYERMQTDVKARHILVRFPNNNPSPFDTLKAYKQIQAYQKRIGKEGFDKIFNEISAKKSKEILAEDLGYFTAFRMVYPFETAAYNTPEGKTSPIVRTQFGYHILKVDDKRPAKGSIQVAHIFVKSKDSDTPEQQKAAEDKIQKIYNELENGSNFEKLAKQYSEDRGSAQKGGVLPWFTTGQMVPEFEEAAFSIKENGQYSKPFKTIYGWHIVKRLDYKPIPAYEEALPYIKQQIQKDSRSQVSKKMLIAKLKKEYNYTPYMKNVDRLIKIIDDSFYEGKWDASKAAKFNKPVFSLKDDKYAHREVVYTQKDFADFLEKQQRRKHKLKGKELFYNLFDEFVNQKIIEFEDSNLEYKYPEFKALLREYADGILLFDLKDKNIWSKAVSDTAGLKAFYEAHKQNYLWPERAKVYMIKCSNEKYCTKAEKIAKKALTKNKDLRTALEKLNKKQQNVEIIEAVVAKGEDKNVDNMEWKKGSVQKIDNEKVLAITDILPPSPKPLDEIRGLVISDYQKYLEDKWMEELKSKHEIQVFEDVLKNVQAH
jgi:peptidyl-prolyl cis-trans isomerase SurA